MANVIYNGYKKSIGVIDWAGATDFNIMLVDDTYAPDIDNHKVVDDVTGEVVGTGYTAGGQTLANRVITEDDTNDLAKFDCDDATFSNVSITTRGAIIYLNTGDTATSTLIAYLDFTSNQAVSSSDFTLSFATDGVFTIA